MTQTDTLLHNALAEDEQWRALNEALLKQIGPVLEDLDPVMATQDRLWKFFRMAAPTDELEPFWAMLLLGAMMLIVELPPSPERTIALRKLLEARSAVSLADFEVRLDAAERKAEAARAVAQGDTPVGDDGRAG
jgi:hypothetical protein